MPGRKITKRVETPAELMGEDAWVEYRDPSMAELGEFRKQTAVIQKKLESLVGDGVTDALDKVQREAEDFQATWLSTYITAWNWVADESGETPLPQPHNNPDVFKDLMASELKWLGELFNVSIEKKRLSR